MTALTAGRNTSQRSSQIYSRGIAAGVTLYPGAISMLNAAGYATPGATAVGQIADGIVESDVPLAGGAVAGVNLANIRPGTFQFANSAAADLITIAEIGDDCYIVDDQTVAKTSGGATRSIAGKVTAVDALGVWVRIGI